MTPARSMVVETKIEVKDLQVWYGDVQALRGVSIAVPALTTVAFIGAAGSGKTTLLKSINRLHELDPTVRVAGSVKLDGAEVTGADIDLSMLRRRAGMIFTRPALLPMSVFDNVTFGLRAMGMREREHLEMRCERALRQAMIFDVIKGLLKASAESLPLVVQQQLCIARALAVEPDVLLLDDPTCKLDPVAALTLEELILKLRSDFTVLMATNNLQQAARLSDTACYLSHGSIIEMGDTTAIFSRPTDSRTEDFLTGRAS